MIMSLPRSRPPSGGQNQDVFSVAVPTWRFAMDGSGSQARQGTYLFPRHVHNRTPMLVASARVTDEGRGARTWEADAFSTGS